ncbi:MAG TPA: response regulator, partial [Chitinophagaceae bacterium]|nr:response regulator [Chitinophagaceae bacterium]
MKLSLKRNLLIGFGTSLLILIISSAASIISINNLFTSAALVNHTNAVAQKLEQTISVMKDAETGQRGFLITGKDEFLEPYTGSYEKTKTLIEEIKNLTGDNPLQQKNIDKLDELVMRRFMKLQELIDKKKLTAIVSLADMQAGKQFMDSVREMVKEMTINENALLKQRTDKLSRFTSITPILIITAALLAIIITILFYIRTNRDFTERAKLQEELMLKDAAISRRIRIIQGISEKISAGDYSVRVHDSETDDLGSIAVALNKMTASLEQSFNTLADKEWLQSGIAGLNETIIGDDNLPAISHKIMAFTATYSNSQAGALYILENEDLLTLENGYALVNGQVKKQLRAGEGLVGQSAKTRQPILVKDIHDEDLTISFASGTAKPSCIIVFPLLFENKVKGVIELGALHSYSDRELDFFRNISGTIGIAINTVQNRQRVQELLEETQSQSEELMSQQSEMEQINNELEAQARQLQTSEEELKVQSEELQQTNTMLEEKSISLEQRNQLILQKNREIEKKAGDLALSTKYKSEFLANMSHELRTPLNSILLLSRLMAENNEQNLTKEQIEYAQVIQGSGNGLLQLIDEILDLSKIESGKMTIEYLPVQVSAITTAMHELFAPLAKEKKLQWKVIMGAGIPTMIETDRMRLEQVLKNLLSNAFKFTAEGYIHLLLSVPANRPGFICFIIKDSGIGISNEKQELIFEAFQQEDGSTRRKYGGTGLGLSISRELAKLLGGEITLTSIPGEGSEFVCCIPQYAGNTPVQPKETALSPATEKPADTFSTAQRLAGNADYYTAIIPDEISDDRNNIETGDKVLLIIEDDVNFAAALLDYSRQKGYKGIVAVRGDKGIEMAAAYLPAGILLDIRLPVKNGWEVMDELKNNIYTRHIPVHIMSSFELKKESLLKGAVDFINKPVAFEKLNTIFEKLEFVLSKKDKKVLIIEENDKHAKALAYYLAANNVSAAIFQSVEDSVQSLYKKEVDCVILDMSVMDKDPDQLLEKIRDHEGLEDLPIILFTGKSLSQPEEFKIKQYADAIVLKTAHSYKRVLDEVSLFLHLVQQQQNKKILPDFERFILEENVLKGKKVLLADDDVRNIFSMTKTLEKYQMQVIPAMDGREALQLVQTNKVDVVLMDMMMPEMDGYESIRAIRKKPQYKNIPIIAVTAKAMSGDREKCITAGASDYISKPVDMDQLISLLRI